MSSDYDQGVSKWNLPARVWNWVGGAGTGRSNRLTDRQREGKNPWWEAAPEGYYEGDRGPLMSDDPDFAKQQSIRGRIEALGRALGWDKDKITNLAGPQDWRELANLSPEERGAKLEAHAALANRMQKLVDETKPEATRLVSDEGKDMYDQLPEENAGLVGPPHSSISYPPYAGRGEKRGRQLNSEDTGMFHGPFSEGVGEPKQSENAYDLEMARRQGILTPEQESKVKAEWADKLVNPLDQEKARRRSATLSNLAEAFLVPGASGKYAAPVAAGALDAVRRARGRNTDEFDRKDDAFQERLKNLESGLDYDKKYSEAEQERMFPQLTVNGEPVNAAEFELLMKHSPELVMQLTGQAVGNDPRITGPMAQRYMTSGTEGAKEELQRAQAAYNRARALREQADIARSQGMQTAEIRKLEAEADKLEQEANSLAMQAEAFKSLMGE